MSKPLHQDGYELIDFGDGRKLERYGSLLLDRPSVAAEAVRKSAAKSNLWSKVDLSFQSVWKAYTESGTAALTDGWSASMNTAYGTIRTELKASPAGHVGLFPEHLPNFEKLFPPKTASQKHPELRVLNLFAYTGFGSLQCALAGCAVTHVDASKPAVQWAKRNYEMNSGQARGLRVRYLVDDAMAFCQREIRRGNIYDVVCLDPPAYGHGPAGKAWQLDRDLPSLIEAVSAILSPNPIAVMISGHSDEDELRKLLQSNNVATLRAKLPNAASRSSELITSNGRRLNAGYSHLWTSFATYD